MTIISCPECSKDISSDAKSCPHCGKLCVQKSGTGKFISYTLFIIVGLFAVFVMIGVLSGGKSGTYGDVASEAESICKRKHPDAPDSYCRSIGLQEAMTELCKDKPWKCGK